VGARWVPRGCPGAPKNQAGMGGFGWKLAESFRNVKVQDVIVCMYSI
jgi:hypothetical protein